jgi:hypothetical protein
VSNTAVITEEKLRIFQRYGGDVDGWVRVGDETEHRIMSDADWSHTEQLRHRLWLQQHHSASSEFVEQTEQLIAERVPDESAVKLLRQLT